MTASNLVSIPELFVSQESAAKLKAEAGELVRLRGVRTFRAGQRTMSWRASYLNLSIGNPLESLRRTGLRCGMT